MRSRRPPPLPKSLFAPQGQLSPNSAPLPPSPSTIHPDYIIDSHSFIKKIEPTPDPIYDGLDPSFPRPPVKSAVQVKMDVSAEPAQAVLGVKPFSIHPTVLNLTLVTPPSITNIAKGAVDIIVPSTFPLSEKEWDLLDEAVDALDGCWGNHEVAGNKPVTGENGKEPGKVVISGILPPPLTQTSTPLFRSDSYNLHLARLANLSLHANVYLKALPPVVDTIQGKEVDGKWWEDRQELERVLRMYISPAIEAFGTHRIIFGSTPALPIPELSRVTPIPGELEQPISNGEWYSVLRRIVTQLGEGKEEVTGVMGGNAAKVYRLA
ncbi:uncharacterized protein I206_101488 [Kwoniella pini CBS 10737]|uniref:Amidohydrolase-related domain-containing protein n=1 Tax=Kwoniella pini CBS 10737 TaxID=1296096 RepID=A0A1B9HWI2_9TREE|nr:uncharacterized protein I206_06539 [Kwoniella pini CBS 10737]OCF47636.1 hypothetical protein I206_06539 [Kwoniella pini CBS 10737]